MSVLPSGSIIGILGGGQLGRMTALAAAKLGYRCHIFCPNDQEPAVDVSAFHTKAAFDDTHALSHFAKAVDVVTLEWENVPLQALEIIGQHKPTYPSAGVLEIAQDRGKEKTFARSLGIGTADFLIIRSAAELEKTIKRFQLPAILKSTRMGYDGKGQVKVTAQSQPQEAWKEMGSDVGILEAFIDFEREISVIVARDMNGDMKCFPPVENIHRNYILAETHAPAAIDRSLADEAERIAKTMAEKIGVIGLLAIEMFVLKKPNSEGQSILINEIAPRPHNSGHWTMDACSVSQFDQLVRVMCGLPLGDTTPHSQAVMHNLIGDDVKKWPELLKNPNAYVHLYGKTEIRAGRKMGHVTTLHGKW